MSVERERQERGPGLVLALVLVLGIASVWLPRTPAPLPASAPLEAFSAERAGRFLGELARAPHPVGSDEHEHARETLVAALTGMGLEPEEQRGISDETRASATRLRGYGLEPRARVPISNVLVRIPGTNPTGTLLCMAHYDSVPTGPGAGDDAIGTASWVEALRALRAATWTPRNDVVFLWTDGEELGLLGAQLFASEHPLARDVRSVVNLEAIGNGGPAVLFELGPGNGPRVRAFADVVRGPTGTSLGDAVYRHMPNDTDLTVFLRRGVGGFNFAITSGSAAYHAPHDTPANLDPRSLQHMGECALALARHLGDADLGALDGGDVTFFDVLGRVLVAYPNVWDVVLTALGALAALLVLRRTRVRPSALVADGARFLGGVVVLSALTGAAWWLLDRAAALFAEDPGWVPGNTTSSSALLLALIGAVVAAELRRARRTALAETADARGLTALVLLTAAALYALVELRGAAFALYLPLVLTCFAWSASPRPVLARIVLPLALLATLVLGLPIPHQLLQLFQRTPGPAVVLVTAALAFVSGSLAPHWRAMVAGGRAIERGAWALAGLALVASVLVARVLEWRQGALLP